MMNWLRKHRYKIFLITVLALLASTFMGSGSYFLMKSPQDAAVTVNGEKISYKRYQTRLRLVSNQAQGNAQEGAPPPDAMVLERNTIQSLVQETVFSQEARNYGLLVTNNELAAYIQSIPAFQKDGQFDQARYLQIVQTNLRMSTEDFEEDRRQEVLGQKLQRIMRSSVHITPIEFDINLQKRLADAPPEEKKLLLKNPEEFRKQLHSDQASAVLHQWSTDVGAKIKLTVHLDRWRGPNPARSRPSEPSPKGS